MLTLATAELTAACDILSPAKESKKSLNFSLNSLFYVASETYSLLLTLCCVLSLWIGVFVISRSCISGCMSIVRSLSP